MATTPDGLGRGTMRGIVGGFALSNVDILGMPQCMPQQKTQPSLTEARHQTVDELMSELGLQVRCVLYCSVLYLCGVCWDPFSK